MEKFYNNSTKFNDEIILKETDVIFIDKNTNITNDKNTDSKIYITKYIEDVNGIQYSENKFKNEIIILYKKLYDIDDKIQSNIYNIFDSLKKEKSIQSLDNFLYPIIHVNKIFYIDNEDDEITANNNVNIIKRNLEDFILEYNNIKKDISYINKEENLYKLQKPFEDDNNNLKNLNLINYIPENDRDALSNCIINNLDDISNNNQCVNIDNNPVNIETFRILSSKSFNIDNKEYKLYDGDNVKIIGYVSNLNKLLTTRTFSIFDIEKYYNDLEDLNSGDKVNIYFNISNKDIIDNNFNLKGKIKSITNDNIKIVLNKKITIDNIKLNILNYDKNSDYNDFYIYPENIDNNIYYKKQLYDNVTVFLFPENKVKDNNENNINKYIKFIVPSINEFITYYDNFFNYRDLKLILNKYKYDFNKLDTNDLSIINNKLKNNIDNYNINNTPKIKQKKKNKFEYDGELFNMTNIPSSYGEYSNLNILDNIENRLLFLKKKNDMGNTYFTEKLISRLNEDFNDIKDINFKEKLKLYTKEYDELKAKLEKYNDEDCEQIKIAKFYYNENEFLNDEGNSKYNNLFVILNNDYYSTIYKMNNGNWEKIKILYSRDIDSIKFCDNSYYYENVKKNSCVYDEIDDLCNKRNKIKDRKHFELIEFQINLLKELKDFYKNYDDYIKSLNNDIEKNKYITNNEYNFEKITFEKKYNKNNYVGDDNYIDVLSLFNNFEQLDDNYGEILPIIPDEEKPDDSYIDDKDYMLIDKIINSIGIINLHEKYIMYIFNNINKYSDLLLKSSAKNEKVKKLLILASKKKSSINDEKNNKLRIQIEDAKKKIKKLKNKHRYLYISSILIIFIQMLYPEIQIKMNKNFSDSFSLSGFPIQPESESDNDKSLLKYVTDIINFISSSNDKESYKLNDFINVIKIIIIKESILKKKLKENIDNIIPNKDKKFIAIIWKGFKPEIKIDKEPNTIIGRYIYTIYKTIENKSVYKYNLLNKPLILNVCCLEKINKDFNYYNLFKNQLNSFDLTNIDKNNVLVREVFINIIKRKLFSHFDNDEIFDVKKLIKMSKDKLNTISYFNNNYFNYTDNIKKILLSDDNATFIKNQISNDINLNNILKDDKFNNKGSWDKFTTLLQKMFDKIIKFTNKYSTDSMDKDIQEDLKSYFIKLNDFDEENLNKIKKISEQFITYNISSIITKIKNLKKVSENNKKFMDEKEKSNITEIYKDNNINKFILKLDDYDNFSDFNSRFLENDKIFNTKFNVLSMNISNDDNEETEYYTNIIKNIYILNYIFLTIILYIYFDIIKNKSDNDDDDSDEFNIETILDDIENSHTIESTDNNNKYLEIYADIVSVILTEYRNNIKNNIFDLDKLKEKIKNLREDVKKEKLSSYDKLSKDLKQIKKLVDDIVGVKLSEDDMDSQDNLYKINNYLSDDLNQEINNENQLENNNNQMFLPENDENDEYDY